jgi:NADP-dependent 3-hydroxy acid dehydrogenase YdfG
MKTRSGVSTSQETKGFALITGASSGIGEPRGRRALARLGRGALLGASTAAAIAIGVLETPLIR